MLRFKKFLIEGLTTQKNYGFIHQHLMKANQIQSFVITFDPDK
jgi:hypothetical protein